VWPGELAGLGIPGSTVAAQMWCTELKSGCYRVMTTGLDFYLSADPP
jgi:hypothetical protein